MSQSDTIQRFIFENNDIRGEIVHLDGVLEQLFTPHNYPAVIQQILAEAVICTAFIASAFKFSGILTLQFQSDKAIKLLLVKSDHNFNLRAISQFDDDADDKNLVTCMDDGQLMVTIQPDSNTKPYQSIVKIQGNLSDSLSFYFQQSEQIPTYFHIVSTPDKAAGMMLQQLPANKSQDSDSDWQHCTTIASTINRDELLNVPNETLLHRLFHDLQCRVFDEKPIKFHCPCTQAKMLEAIRTIGQEEANQILSTHKCIDITCEFCQKHYGFDKNDIAYLFQTQ